MCRKMTFFAFGGNMVGFSAMGLTGLMVAASAFPSLSILARAICPKPMAQRAKKCRRVSANKNRSSCVIRLIPSHEFVYVQHNAADGSPCRKFGFIGGAGTGIRGHARAREQGFRGFCVFRINLTLIGDEL